MPPSPLPAPVDTPAPPAAAQAAGPEPSFTRFRRLWPAWCVLALALAVTAWVWRDMAADYDDDARTEFEHRADELILTLRARLISYERMLIGARALFEISDNVGREQWRTWISALNLDVNYPGVESVAYAAWVSAAEREAHIARMRADGLPGYDLHPPGWRAEMTPVIYMEPLRTVTLNAFGYDPYADPVHRRAIEAARDTARTAATGPVHLLPGTRGEHLPGFLLYLPVYRRGASADIASVDARRAAIQGLITVPLRMEDFTLALKMRVLNDMVLDIVDVTDGSKGVPLYSSRPDHDALGVPRFSATRSIDVYGRVWALHFHSLPPFAQRVPHTNSTIALAVGLTVSLLLFGLVSTVLRTRERALHLASRMTQALSDSEQRFKLAMQGSAQGVWERRYPAGFTAGRAGGDAGDAYFSPRFKELLGYPENEPDELPDRFDAFESRIHPAYRARFTSAFASHLHARQRFELELQLRTKNQGFRWFRVYGQAQWDEAGHPMRMAGSILDITEQWQTMEALRLSEERLKLALEGAGRALFDWQVESDTLYLSREFALIIGTPGDAAPAIPVTSREFGARLHAGDAALQYRALIDALKGAKPACNVDCRLRREDGSWRWVQVEGQVTERSTDGRALRMIGTIGDISERKETERARSEFIATVSHELRTPLTSIQGALAAVAIDLPADFDAEARHMLDIARHNSQRLLRLTNDILDLDSLEAGRMTFELSRRPLSGPIAEAVTAVKPYASALNVAIRVYTAQTLHAVVDEGRFVQVLTNLLANAAKYSPPGSVIEVTLAAEGASARVTVTDQGSGIAEDFRRSLFQKFAQSNTAAARVAGGAGLGLNIVRTLTEGMGGRVGYYPATGGGSAFYVEFPLS